MRMLFAAILLTVSSTAHAQFGVCKSISDNKSRLDCYDNAAAASSRPTGKQTAAPKLVDEMANEDEKMKKLLKPICRNC